MTEVLPAGSRWEARLFFVAVLITTLCGTLLMADFLRGSASDWGFAESLLLGLFFVLFGYLAFGFCHAMFGFVMGRVMSRREPPANKETSTDTTAARVAVVIPVYNEPVPRVFAGIRAIYDSLSRQPRGDAFDIFILSDSNRPDQWIAEEAAWMQLLKDRSAQDRIFYRRRPSNEGKKSGNVADFCRTWGEHYDYMVVLDADSVMSGETLIELLHRMEANPSAGLIQTAPKLVGGESLFGRMQQFANHLYGPLFMRGLAFWQQEGGNFWGHNAIIRLRPFIEQCDLPLLPGRKPFGGHILSHDFIEAALLRRAGWEVWLADDLGGSYEEGPQGIIESAQRDRRWCQGNLQHSMLVFAHGLRKRTRAHLINGILGYVASPLWLAFILVSLWLSASGGLDSVNSNQGWLIFGITMVLLFSPKLLCLLDLFLDRQRAKAFGGRANAVTSAVVETFFSALIAPINMLFHTRFVICNILGITVGWATQKRGASGTSWEEAIAAHGLQTLAGVGLAALAAFSGGQVAFWWVMPVVIGLILSIPISVWTSRPEYGFAARQEKMFLIPEERVPTQELTEALQMPAEAYPLIDGDGIVSVVLDPFLNAVHVSLLRRNRRRLLTGRQVHGDEAAKAAPTLNTADRWHELADQMLREGPEAIDDSDKMGILSDIDIMLWLHRQAWLRSSQDLAPSWQLAMRHIPVAMSA